MVGEGCQRDRDEGPLAEKSWEGDGQWQDQDEDEEERGEGQELIAMIGV